MSVSDMNVSWSSLSSRPTRRSKGNNSSVFLTEKNNPDAGSRAQRPACVSAKISGMRFQSWREPKPLRSRCGSAGQAAEEPERPQTEKPRTGSSSPSKPVGRDMLHEAELRESISRLSQPTASSRHKTTNRAREAGTDMNWYSWSKMNVYKDYQGVLYKGNGAMKKAVRGKER